MNSTIKIGVLGAGNFANNQHLPNLAKIDCAEVVAISDVNGEAVTRTAAKFGIPRTYTDGHAMLESEDLDAMWSIIPAFARTDVEATAAARGIHLFSEKPQAMTMEVARRIDNAIAESGVLSTVCFRERYRPIFMEAKRLLQDKKIVHIRFQSVGPATQSRARSRMERSAGERRDELVRLGSPRRRLLSLHERP